MLPHAFAGVPNKVKKNQPLYNKKRIFKEQSQNLPEMRGLLQISQGVAAKVIKRTSLILMLFVLTGCPSPYWTDRVNIVVVNDSDMDIACFFPRELDYPVEGYPYHVYPDTAITFSRQFVQFPFKAKTEKEYVFVGFYDISNVYNYYKTDTLSFFVFNNALLEGKGPSEWEAVAKFYYVKVRYDLSVEDMNRLMVDGVPTLHYPPDERMKNIKMWPPYEEAIKQQEMDKTE